MNYRRKGTTIYDIARVAEVSPTTVSRVLNDTTYPVSEELRARVLEAADGLNYTARGKLRPTERDVVVMVPNLSNLFYTTLISGIEASMRMFGLNMLLMNTRGDVGLEQQLITELCSRSSVRLIIAPVCDDLSHLQPLLHQGADIVVLEQPAAGKASSIYADLTQGGMAAVNYLLSRNLRRIAFLGTPLTRFSRTTVYEGYCEALVKAGIPLDEKLVFLGGTSPFIMDEEFPFRLGMELLDQVMEKCDPLPDALLCSNDMIAIGAMRRLQERRIRVPEDISVMGMDNICLAAISTPKLTTMDPCTYEVGRIAVETLYATLMGSTGPQVNRVLETRLVQRDSVR